MDGFRPRARILFLVPYREGVKIVRELGVGENRAGFGQDFFIDVAPGDVRENQLPHPALFCQFRHGASGGVPELLRHRGFFLQVGRFNHQRICAPNLLPKLFRLAHIPDHHKARAGFFLAQHLVGFDYPAVG